MESDSFSHRPTSGPLAQSVRNLSAALLVRNSLGGRLVVDSDIVAACLLVMAGSHAPLECRIMNTITSVLHLNGACGDLALGLFEFCGVVE